MDDLIVIILTLVFIVAGIFGQMKKKPPVPEADPGQPYPEEDNFWDIPDEDIDEKKQAAEIPVPVQNREMNRSFWSNEYQIKPENEGATITDKKLTSDGQVKKQNRLHKKGKFPLREAVIYSEILHRKYN